MNLHLNEEQRMMQKMVRDFAREKVEPLAKEMDERDEYPRALVKEMGRLGFMGIPIGTQYGGSGMDFLSYIIAIHELSKVSAAVGVILSVHTSVVSNPILQFGNKMQRERYLKKLAKGEWIGAFALTEPQAGSDAAAIRPKAVKDGADYVLNGEKLFITNADSADLFLVFAVTDPERGKDGVTAFLVERDAPGLFVGRNEKKMGLNGSGTAPVSFSDVRVSAENRLGVEGEGYRIAMANLQAGRIGIAAQALGIAEAAFEAAREYAGGRKQFGRPIAKQQAVAFKLADMATEIEAARLLTYRAAALYTKGISCRRESSMAKLFASTTARRAAIEAVQIFGGYGYTKDYPVERLFRDAKVTEIYEGTSEIQRHVISKSLLEQ